MYTFLISVTCSSQRRVTTSLIRSKSYFDFIYSILFMQIARRSLRANVVHVGQKFIQIYAHDPTIIVWNRSWWLDTAKPMHPVDSDTFYCAEHFSKYSWVQHKSVIYHEMRKIFTRNNLSSYHHHYIDLSKWRIMNHMRDFKIRCNMIL